MLIPFNTTRRVTGRVTSPLPIRASERFQEFSDGSYVVGILDGIVVGATVLSNGLRIVDFADATEVLTMLREHLPAEVRVLVREQLLKAE